MLHAYGFNPEGGEKAPCTQTYFLEVTTDVSYVSFPKHFCEYSGLWVSI